VILSKSSIIRSDCGKNMIKIQKQLFLRKESVDVVLKRRYISPNKWASSSLFHLMIK